MDAVEAVAASPPFSARTITLNTIAAINQTDQKWCEEVGYAYGPDVPITEHWYVRRGYVSYKPNEPRYPWTIKRTGESVVLDGAVSIGGDYASLIKLMASLSPSSSRKISPQVLEVGSRIRSSARGRHWTRIKM